MSEASGQRSAAYLTAQPACLQYGKLRDYQLEGLNWMINLHDNGVNGILADEMGLGKTVQSVALLAYLLESRGVRGPHLVVVPKSTLGNWQKEFGRWCPDFNVLRLQGPKEERSRMVSEGLMSGAYDVILTTFEVVILEKAALRKFSWCYIIVDEAHRIKNEKSALATELRRLESAHRLLVTGTPLQNNLHELWALLNFLLPDVFASSDDFDSWFSTADGSVQQGVVHKMHAILKPFLLRRLKVDVESGLPPKTETKLFVGLTPMQREWYRKMLAKDSVALNTLGGPDKVRLQNVLMQLRKVCNHPYLFDGAEPGPPHVEGPHLWESCGKMSVLHKLLSKLQGQGSRVLIFSQMTRMLDILEDYCTYVGLDFCRIDGNTSGEDRDEAMETFNAPGSKKFVFLLSTRAGGLGINLATADVVVLYDSDWNPQADLQAMDRAHRIGQTKPVRVFRFVTESTVEEKIVERAERKLYLDAVVIQQGRLAEQNRALSREELLTMVTFGADEVFQSKGGDVTDDDIDAILARGRERTEEGRERVKSDMQHNLRSFTLDASAGADRSIYLFDSKDYSKIARVAEMGTLVDLGQRERKQRLVLPKPVKRAPRTGPPRLARMPVFGAHNFIDTDRLKVVVEAENDALVRLRDLKQRLREAERQLRKFPDRWVRDRALELQAAGTTDEEAMTQATAEAGPREAELRDEVASLTADIPGAEVPSAVLEEKQALLAAGFPSWSRSDFQRLIAACERHGRNDEEAVVEETTEETSRSAEEVRAYLAALWGGKGRGSKGRVHELPDAKRIVARVERGEAKIQGRLAAERVLAAKVARHATPWRSLRLDYSGAERVSREWTAEEDRFLACIVDDTGYGEWATAAAEASRAHQFRFDWFIKSRTEEDLQSRTDEIIELLQAEAPLPRKAARPAEGGRRAAGAPRGGRLAGRRRPAAAAAAAAEAATHSDSDDDSGSGSDSGSESDGEGSRSDGDGDSAPVANGRHTRAARKRPATAGGSRAKRGRRA